MSHITSDLHHSRVVTPRFGFVCSSPAMATWKQRTRDTKNLFSLFFFYHFQCNCDKKCQSFNWSTSHGNWVSILHLIFFRMMKTFKPDFSSFRMNEWAWDGPTMAAKMSHHIRSLRERFYDLVAFIALFKILANFFFLFFFLTEKLHRFVSPSPNVCEQRPDLSHEINTVSIIWDTRSWFESLKKIKMSMSLAWPIKGLALELIFFSDPGYNVRFHFGWLVGWLV